MAEAKKSVREEVLEALRNGHPLPGGVRVSFDHAGAITIEEVTAADLAKNDGAEDNRDPSMVAINEAEAQAAMEGDEAAAARLADQAAAQSAEEDGDDSGKADSRTTRARKK